MRFSPSSECEDQFNKKHAKDKKRNRDKFPVFLEEEAQERCRYSEERREHQQEEA